MLHPDDRDRVLTESDETNRTGEPFDIEYRIVAADGRIVWLHDHAMVVAGPDGKRLWHGVLQDITAEKAAEGQLREAEAITGVRGGDPREQFLDEYVPTTRTLADRLYQPAGRDGSSATRPDEWQADPWIWKEMIHPDDRERVARSGNDHYVDGEALDVEHRVTAKDGTIWSLRDSSSIVRDEDGRPRFSHGFLIDVGERKAAEQAMHDAERRYRSLIETLPSVTYIDTLGEDSVPVYVSPQVATIFGYAPDEWRSMDRLWPSRLHPDDRERTLDAVRAHASTLEPFDAEYRFQHRDGTWMWLRDQAVMILDEQGTPRYSQGICSTSPKGGRRTRSARPKSAIAPSSNTCRPRSTSTWRTARCARSTSARRSKPSRGSPPQEWMDDPEPGSAIVPEDRDQVERGYLRAISRGNGVERRVPHAHTRRSHDLGARRDDVPARRRRQADCTSRASCMDITERKLAEQALRESEQREREAAERLRALDEMKNTFLAAVSHELRSPLTSILGLSITLERHAGHGRRRPDRPAGAVCCERPQARPAAQGSARYRPAEPRHRGAAVPHRPTSAPSPGGPSRASTARRTHRGDRRRRRRDRGRSAEARAHRREPRDERRAAHGPRPHDLAQVTAARRRRRCSPSRTTARGFRPSIREAIFEPFRQGPSASPHSPGTGIGLSLVARFAQLHGGRAWVGEREGGGAAFHVFLPGERDGALATGPSPVTGQDEGDAQLSRADAG